VSEYPEYEKGINKLNSDLQFRYTGWVLDLLNITDTENIMLPTTLKRLSILKRDNEIKKYIDDCFMYMEEECNLKMKRVSWWKEVLNSM